MAIFMPYLYNTHCKINALSHCPAVFRKFESIFVDLKMVTYCGTAPNAVGQNIKYSLFSRCLVMRISTSMSLNRRSLCVALSQQLEHSFQSIWKMSSTKWYKARNILFHKFVVCIKHNAKNTIKFNVTKCLERKRIGCVECP